MNPATTARRSGPAPRRSFDLNTVRPDWATKSRQGFDWDDNRRDISNGSTTVHFGDLSAALIEFIRGSEAVVGCVAWITNRDIVGALAERPVSIIVNKEWALRATDRKASSQRQRALLGTLGGGLLRKDFPKPLSDIPTGSDSIDAVRCVGHSARGGGNTPLMHSKFIIRLHRGKPVAVWTGSFNFTTNASSNIENAVEIHDAVIARAYLDEYARVASISEPLEFKAGKADPEWEASRTPRKPVTKDTATAKKVAPARTVKAGSRAHKGSKTAGKTGVSTRTRGTTTTKKGRRR